MLGKTDDIAMIDKKMAAIKDNFDRTYWTGSEYRSPSYKNPTDDRSQAMAVVSGLAPESRYPDIIKLLDTEYNASPYMEKYVLEALFIMGEPQRAIERMHKRYAKMLGYKDYHNPLRRLGHRCRRLWRRYYEPCLERRPPHPYVPENMRCRAYQPRLQDI